MVLSGAFLISFSAVFVKWAHVSPTIAGFYRNLFGGLLLALITLVQRKRLWKSGFYFLFACASGLFFSLDLFVWHQSIHFVGPGLATILANFQVFFVALIGILFLGERLSIRLILAMPLAILGLFLLAGIDWPQLGKHYQIGIVLGLAAALFYALYLLSLRKIQSAKQPLSPTTNLSVVCGVAAGFLGMAAWFQHDSFVIPDGQSWAALLAYGFFSQVLGWMLITKGLPKVSPALAGLLLLLQPALAFTWDIFFFNRPLNALSGLGALIAFGAIYMGLTAKPRRNP
jgi:drug/metabolite transporter (DMT)-like permease